MTTSSSTPLPEPVKPQPSNSSKKSSGLSRYSTSVLTKELLKRLKRNSLLRRRLGHSIHSDTEFGLKLVLVTLRLMARKRKRTWRASLKRHLKQPKRHFGTVSGMLLMQSLEPRRLDTFQKGNSPTPKDS